MAPGRIRVMFFEGGENGGSVLSLAKLLEGLSRHGCDVGLVSYFRRTSPVDLFSLGCVKTSYCLDAPARVRPRPEVSRRTLGIPHPTAFGMQYLRVSLKALVRYRPHVAYLNNGVRDHLPALTAAKLLRIPVVSHLRGSERLTWADRRGSRYVDHFIVLTEWGRIFYHSQGIPLEKLTQLYNPICTSTFDHRAKERLAIPLKDDSIYVIQTGKLSVHKRPDLAIEAFTCAQRECPKLRLILAGDGPMRGDLEQLVADRGLGDRVLLIGHCRQIPGLLRRCHIGLHCSRSEGQANSVMESMAATLPVVAWNHPAMVEFVKNGKTGLIASKPTAEAIGRALVALYTSPELRKRMGYAGREYVTSNRFSSAMYIPKLRKILHALVTGS